jgi:hypothetical protein
MNLSKAENLSRLKYDLDAAYISRCDCWEVDRQVAEDLSTLIVKLERKISEIEEAA